MSKHTEYPCSFRTAIVSLLHQATLKDVVFGKMISDFVQKPLEAWCAIVAHVKLLWLMNEVSLACRSTSIIRCLGCRVDSTGHDHNHTYCFSCCWPMSMRLCFCYGFWLWLFYQWWAVIEVYMSKFIYSFASCRTFAFCLILWFACLVSFRARFIATASSQFLSIQASVIGVTFDLQHPSTNSTSLGVWWASHSYQAVFAQTFFLQMLFFSHRVFRCA